ncbi:MAG: hypothetical protein P8186_26600 [Anaerolineae bacterium]|jgi:hypothetical protein
MVGAWRIERYTWREATMSNNGSTYKSYLLRLFRAAPGAPWRATLKSISGAGEPRHFPDLESLAAYLLAEFEPPEGPPPAAASQPNGPER